MRTPAGRSTLGAFVVLPLEQQLNDPAGRSAIAERLTRDFERMRRACLAAAQRGNYAEHRKLNLLVECLSAARRVVERSASFENAPSTAVNKGIHHDRR
ncbi:hypothetical protein AWB67_01101 [Caballeronia terrestris]|jgi:hypothetical protein|uniref:Uncharacterized protein n=1 Tax=Caballeronia terrestris TaxID=1226301 RepID=A0A158G4K3_9BURK|nr:hypothetical protein AWB67_01101 [Caballeronia terrestris]